SSASAQCVLHAGDHDRRSLSRSGVEFRVRAGGAARPRRRLFVCALRRRRSEGILSAKLQSDRTRNVAHVRHRALHPLSMRAERIEPSGGVGRAPDAPLSDRSAQAAMERRLRRARTLPALACGLRARGVHRGSRLVPARDPAMRKIIETLAGSIGERNATRPRAYADAAAFIEKSLPSASRQNFDSALNIECAIRGNDEIIVVGAHYDTVVGSPGADETASGVAAMITMAHALAESRLMRTVRFVAFANEEPPFFATPQMGSFHYARRCRDRRENVVAMFSLESIGYFSDAPDSQQ